MNAREAFIDEFGKSDSSIGENDAILSEDLVLGFSEKGREAFKTEYLKVFENYSKAILAVKHAPFDACFVSKNRTITLVKLEYLLRAIKVLGGMDQLDQLEFYVCKTEDRNPVFIENGKACIALAPRTKDGLSEKEIENIKERSKEVHGVFSSYSKDDFTKIKGIGPKTAENLKHYGFFSFEHLHRAKPRSIAKVPSVGEKTARMIKENL